MHAYHAMYASARLARARRYLHMMYEFLINIMIIVIIDYVHPLIAHSI